MQSSNLSHIPDNQGDKRGSERFLPHEGGDLFGLSGPDERLVIQLTLGAMRATGQVVG